MNKQEHLLIVLAEECAELQKEIAKALRFGLNDHEPGTTTTTNKQRIEQEFNDVVGAYKLLHNCDILDDIETVKVHDKMNKIEKWLKYSKEIGTLLD